METVKKLGWQPDVIHCHGWMTLLMPIYLKKLYAKDPHFADTKVVYSLYNEKFNKNWDARLGEKLKFDGFDDEIIDKNTALFRKQYGVDIPAICHSLIRNEQACFEATKRVVEIAKKYNVSQSDLKEWNNLEDTTIQLGTKITVGKKLIAVNDSNAKNVQKESVATAYKKEEVKHYYVRKGDSLFSIAKQYPGVSVSDIKKWNKDVKVESLKPGMKLKING